MDERKFIKKCKELVRNYYNDRVESIDKTAKSQQKMYSLFGSVKPCRTQRL